MNRMLMEYFLFQTKKEREKYKHQLMAKRKGKFINCLQKKKIKKKKTQIDINEKPTPFAGCESFMTLIHFLDLTYNVILFVFAEKCKFLVSITVRIRILNQPQFKCFDQMME